MTISLLRITDGTTTLNFSTGDHMELVRYKPVNFAERNKPVTEEILVDFIGTLTQNRNNFNALNRLFEQARNYKKTRHGPRVYLEFDPGSSGTYWHSEISDGYPELDDKTIGVHWEAAFFHLIFHITRYDSSWLGPRTQLPLSNINASDDLSGITVTDSSHQISPISLIGWDDGSIIAWDDGSLIAWGDPVTGAENFVDVSSDAVIGDLPAPIEIQIKNDSSASAKNKEFYLFHNVFSHPIDFNHMLEAESFTGSTVTPSSDANCQGGSKATFTWTGTNETLIGTAPISSALATAAAGGRFKILARWKGAFPYADMFLRFRLLTANGNELWKGELIQVVSTRELTDLDVLPLPPSLPNEPDMKDIQLALYGFRDHSGSHSIVADYFQLSPISGDGGWKYFLARDDGIAYGETLMHDDIEGRNYRLDTDGKKSAEITAIGGPILLVPDQDQRIYINSCDKDGVAKIDQNWKVKLFYRPRRSSL